MANLLLLVSCGGGFGEITSAPKTQDRAGIIASCATVAQAKQFSMSHQTQYRVINAKRKLIEFYGTTAQELKQALPQVKTRLNTVYEHQLVQSGFPSVQNTGNTQFYGAHTPENRSGDVSRFFPHLEQIDGQLLQNAYQGQGVTIAVVDTGVYYNHPHISSNIKTNSKDPHGDSGDGKDNDGNGYKDDYVGWDFYNGDAYPIDDHGHGTHVAGLAAGTYAGIAPKAKVLPIKVLGSDGRGDLGSIAAGILYAVDRGAHIINLSLGGPAAGQASREINELLGSVIKARSSNALIVAAAGNGGADGIGDCNDDSPVYPASFDVENIVSVASVDLYNDITGYSNFGGETVHVAAPGGDQYTGGLLSLGIPGCFGPCPQSAQNYVAMSGTSMAAPVVSGVAALVKGILPNASYKDIKGIIEDTGTFFSNLEGKVKTSKVVNVRAAVEKALSMK